MTVSVRESVCMIFSNRQQTREKEFNVMIVENRRFYTINKTVNISQEANMTIMFTAYEIL